MDDRKRTRDGKDACREYGVAKSVRIRQTNGAVGEAADELAALRPTTTTGRPFRETAVQPKVSNQMQRAERYSAIFKSVIRRCNCFPSPSFRFRHFQSTKRCRVYRGNDHFFF